MKTILFLAIAFPFTALAQNSASNYIQFYLNRVKYSKKDDVGFSYSYDTIGVKNNNIQKVDVKRSYRGKPKSNYQVLFTQTGEVSAIHRKNDSTFYTYDNGNLIESVSTGKKGIRVEYGYNGNNIEFKESFAKDKLLNRLVVNYNDADDVVLSMFQTGRNLKNTYVMRYTYTDDKISTQQFYKNNKIIKKWDFKCKPEGLEASSKELTNVCKYAEESNDGSYIEYVRRVEDKKVRLFKFYYRADSTNYRSEIYKNDSILIMQTEISETERHQTNFTDKGKVSMIYIAKFDQNHRPIETVYANKGNLNKVSVTTTSYNNDGTVREKQYSYKGKMNSKYTYVYSKYL
jgi:hypothetical protein